MKKNIFIAIFGADGSGKSTVRDCLIKELSYKIKSKILCMHWRPCMVYQKKKAKNEDIKHPGKKSCRSSLFSALYSIFYYLDFKIWYQLTAKNHNGIIIYERYYYDIIFHPKRYRLKPLLGLYKLLCSCSSSPDLIVFLYGDPEKINMRKSELTKIVISDIQNNMFDYFSGRNDVVTFNTTKYSAMEVAKQIIHHTI